MRFAWDQNKAKSNLKKHGISFEEAITAFDDPYALVAVDIEHSINEIRDWLIGESDSGVVTVIFTEIGEGEIYRIISAREADKKERLEYEKYKSISFSLGEKGY